MPLLDHGQVQDLLGRAQLSGPHALDYCRTCDEFYFLDDGDEHEGHRKTIVPFVEDRSK